MSIDNSARLMSTTKTIATAKAKTTENWASRKLSRRCFLTKISGLFSLPSGSSKQPVKRSSVATIDIFIKSC